MADEPEPNAFQELIEERERLGFRAKEFQPCFMYIGGMDSLQYMTEDVTAVSHQADPYVTVQVHGQDQYIVGMRFEGVSRMLQMFKDDLPENRPPTLLEFTNLVYKHLGEWHAATVDPEKRRKIENGYIAARTFAKHNDVPLPEDTLEKLLNKD